MNRIHSCEGLQLFRIASIPAGMPLAVLVEPAGTGGPFTAGDHEVVELVAQVVADRHDAGDARCGVSGVFGPAAVGECSLECDDAVVDAHRDGGWGAGGASEVCLDGRGDVGLDSVVGAPVDGK